MFNARDLTGLHENKLFFLLPLALLSACTSSEHLVGRIESPAAARIESPKAAPLPPKAHMELPLSVFYPVDKMHVERNEDRAVLLAHARFLAEHPEQKVRIEGHCDERGSNEYNLALGLRRAEGVKKLLLLGGAKTDQIETVSYGEEKPKAAGHDEASWSRNRRTDLNYMR